MSWLEKERKKQFKSQHPHPALKISSFFYQRPTIPTSPPLRLLVFNIFSNHPYYSTPRLLENWDYKWKLTPYLFQNDVVLYFESYWKRENVADINFWDFNRLMTEFPDAKRAIFCGWPGEELWLQKANHRLQLIMAYGWHTLAI